jgi:hypothetical protein
MRGSRPIETKLISVEEAERRAQIRANQAIEEARRKWRAAGYTDREIDREWAARGLTSNRSFQTQYIVHPQSSQPQEIIRPGFDGIGVVAIADYIPKSDSEIPLKRGQTYLYILNDKRGWSVVRTLGLVAQQGYVPTSYLRKE